MEFFAGEAAVWGQVRSAGYSAARLDVTYMDTSDGRKSNPMDLLEHSGLAQLAFAIQKDGPRSQTKSLGPFVKAVLSTSFIELQMWAAPDNFGGYYNSFEPFSKQATLSSNAHSFGVSSPFWFAAKLRPKKGLVKFLLGWLKLRETFVF